MPLQHEGGEEVLHELEQQESLVLAICTITEDLKNSKDSRPKKVHTVLDRICEKGALTN